MFRLLNTVSTIKATSSIVAAFVALAIVVIGRAVFGVFTSAWSSVRATTVVAIKEAVAIVARLVAHSILEHFRAGSTSRGGVASVPRVDPKVAVPAVKLAGKLVALRVADTIS